MQRISVTFRCKGCRGTGWEVAGSPCSVCKGRGEVVHMFEDVLKVAEFPEKKEEDYVEFRERGSAPCGGPSYSG
jgi:DnaJ-class molecular chaperone